MESFGNYQLKPMNKWAGMTLAGLGAAGAAYGGYQMGKRAERGKDQEQALAAAFQAIKAQKPNMPDEEAIDLAYQTLFPEEYAMAQQAQINEMGQVYPQGEMVM